jgi:DNA polymerase III gamma/tau subunit
LLKAIEEPNAKMHWIFATTEWRSLPDTIKGRCHMFKFYSITRENLLEHANNILKKEGINTLNQDVINEIIKESRGQPRDLLKGLQIAAENRLDTLEKYFKWLQKPSTKGMVNYIDGVLTGKPTHALTALKAVETSELVEWRRRLEDMIYEMLEDRYVAPNLASYSEPVRNKLRELTATIPVVKFGLMLDSLLRVSNAEDAYRQLYILAVKGV